MQRTSILSRLNNLLGLNIAKAGDRSQRYSRQVTNVLKKIANLSGPASLRFRNVWILTHQPNLTNSLVLIAPGSFE